MKIEIFENNWSINDVELNTDKIFIFSDNILRVGKFSQSIIRDLPNTIGIRTKKGPSTKPAAFFNDSEYEQNIKIIREDILRIKSESLNGNTIVFSSTGYGVNSDKLSEYAPKTFNYLDLQLKLNFHFDNMTGKYWQKIPGYDELSIGKYLSMDKDNSNIIQPINNSFFDAKYLEKNINTTYDLIKTGSKISFTSTNQYVIGEILILTFKGHKDYLVCRVIDSYDINYVIDSGLWHKLEGYDISFKPDDKLLYQTQFEYISTLDTSGNIIYKDGIFSDVVNTNKEAKVVGEKIKNTMKEEELIKKIKELESRLENLEDKKIFKNPFKKSFKKLIELKGISGEIKEIKNDTFPGSKKVYQVKSGDNFYAVQFNEGLLSNSIEIIMISKKSFI